MTISDSASMNRPLDGPALSVSYHDIDEGAEGQRIDNYLLKVLKGVPKSHVYRILRSGEVRVNKGRIDATYRLKIGDRVRVPPIRMEEKSSARDEQHLQQQAERLTFPVLLEDEALLVINKPAGVAVHGGSGISLGVIEALRAQRPQAKFLELVHRLDRETSGVLLVAKKRSALTHLHTQIRNESGDDLVGKSYLALVVGHIDKKRFHAKQPLLKYLLADGERRVRVDPAGQQSHTIFDVLGHFEGAGQSFSLVRATLKTGRTHQIRVHLQAAGFPILGDEKYGLYDLNKAMARSFAQGGLGFKRMFLHAYQLSFIHPRSETEVGVTADLPDECGNLLARLGQQGDAAGLAALRDLQINIE